MSLLTELNDYWTTIAITRAYAKKYTCNKNGEKESRCRFCDYCVL